MDSNTTIKAFYQLGQWLNQVVSGEENKNLEAINRKYFDLILEQIETEHHNNGWFTADYVKKAITGISQWLSEEKLADWISQYDVNEGGKPKKIGLIMAGNIPLVGFHDLLCVLMSGHSAICKLSSKDNRLFKTIIQVLFEIEPGMKKRIDLVEGQLKGFDAVIATGSNNSSRYFDYYFGKYPHIIRRNRNSLAVLTGTETSEELKLLAEDIFMYYGLGCRNVSALMVPEGYNFNHFFESMEHYNTMLNHNKFMNNHDYYRSIYLVNQAAHLDNGFLIVKEEASLASPISITYYQTYINIGQVEEYITNNQEQIQCVVTHASMNAQTVGLGQSQFPGLTDYADNVDTMAFLYSI